MTLKIIFLLTDDPNEQRNLFDERPEIVSSILDKIDLAIDQIQQNVYSNSSGVTPLTTQSLGDLLIPRHDYCTPAVDFPLRPNPASCSAFLSTTTTAWQRCASRLVQSCSTGNRLQILGNPNLFPIPAGANLTPSCICHSCSAILIVV